MSNPCPPHLLVVRTDEHGNAHDWCIGCERYVHQANRFTHSRVDPTPRDFRIDANGDLVKLSCMACVVNALGFNAVHVCPQYPKLEECDLVAQEAGVA